MVSRFEREEFTDRFKTAILVDGGFYRKCARRLWGKKSANHKYIN
nr:MAG TPA: hypothetical protein [Caudoviricetes sp.]